jgi:hypothetical protein
MEPDVRCKILTKNYYGFRYATLIFLYFLAGCAGIDHAKHGTGFGGMVRDDSDRVRIMNLQADLESVGAGIDTSDAAMLAEIAIRYSRQLAAEYRVVRPAILHNLLVRSGLRKRGLCYQWAEDLMKRLLRIHQSSFQFHWGVAYQGSQLREHNSVVVTGREGDFRQGIVLDPWRHSGDLFWTRVTEDRYPWKKIPTGVLAEDSVSESQSGR